MFYKTRYFGNHVLLVYSRNILLELCKVNKHVITIDACVAFL